MSQVVTGEAVALDLRPAALPSRLVAAGIDVLLQLVLLLGLGGLIGAVGPSLSSAAGAALLIVLLVTVLIGYPVLFETLLRGRTPGKAAVGLRTVRDDGGPIAFRHAFVRALAGAFLERPGITLFVAAVVTMLLNPQNKRIGDLLAGTVVLQERVGARIPQAADAVPMPPALAGWASGLDLSGLPDDLAVSARAFLARAAQLTPQARDDLGGRLVAAVTAAVSPAPPPGTPGWAVLAAVLAERRRRAEQRMGGLVTDRSKPEPGGVGEPEPGGVGKPEPRGVARPEPGGVGKPQPEPPLNPGRFAPPQ